MNTTEVAVRLVTLCKEFKNFDAMNELYADEIVSVEAFAGAHGEHETAGKAAVIQKSADWAAAHEIHSGRVEGPYVAQEKFAVIFEFDVTNKASGQRMQMKEVAVYTVASGRITREEFLFALPAA
jgi:ketosteroid isomerase-like protein